MAYSHTTRTGVKVDKLQNILRDVEYGEQYSTLELELQRLERVDNNLSYLESIIYQDTNIPNTPQNI